MNACRILLPSLLWLLVSCTPPLQPDVSDARLKPLTIPAEARRFALVPGQSEVLILVYREGRLARLGHNHAISARQIEGSVYLAPEFAASAVELRVPLEMLEVDRPADRARAGDEFPGELDADAIAGTRSNMLGEEQLEASRWPEMVLVSRALSGADTEFELQVDIALKDTVSRVTVPVKLTRDGSERLIASGEFSVLQTELGLEPFSALLGALRVRDQLDIRFRLVAEATSGN